MSTLSQDFLSRLRGRVRRLCGTDDRGASTLETVIITAGIAVAAVVAVGIIVAAITTYGAQIPTG